MSAAFPASPVRWDLLDCKPGASSSLVNDSHLPVWPHDLKENMTHQTRPLPSIAMCSSSGAHMPTVGTSSDGLHGYSDQSTAAQPPCVFWHFSIIVRIVFSAVGAKVALLCDQTRQATIHFPQAWVLGAKESVTSSLVVLPPTTFGRYWPPHTKNTPQDLPFCRCSDPVV